MYEDNLGVETEYLLYIKLYKFSINSKKIYYIVVHGLFQVLNNKVFNLIDKKLNKLNI